MTATLTTDTPLLQTRSEIIHTRIALELYPYFPTDLAAFQAFELGFEQLLKKSLVLGDNINKGRLEAKHCDHQLNTITDEIARRLNDISDEAQREVIRKQLFGNKKPSNFRKPILGGQLTAMNTWAATLAAVPVDSLKSYAPIVEAAVNKARLAEKALSDAEVAKDHFYSVGEYRAFLDPLNAARNELEGKAAAFRHVNPGLNLPRDFDDLLFKGRERSDDPTPAELFQEAALLESKAAKAKAQAQALIDEEEANEKTRKEAAVQAKLSELSTAEKEATALAAKIEALKAGLPKP